MSDHGRFDRLIDDLLWRGLIVQSTDLGALAAELRAGPVTLYCGFDPTAPSLHLGNLAQIMTVRRFQLAGHRPLALVGGATGLIGDPKMTAERVLNDTATVEEWVGRIRAELEHYYDFDGPNAAVMVNNLDWTGSMSAVEFLRDIGKHFPVSQMVNREAVAARLSTSGISYTEFSYQVLQAHDYLQLFRRYGCRLQTGGSDQWGNIVSGVDLVRRVAGASVHAMTTPLITKADGTKFGKTESGTVWLSPSLTSPYAFFQFWVNADDRDVPTYLRTYSLRCHEEIEALEASVVQRPAAREAQRALALELTTLVHGEAETRAAEAAAAALFGRGGLAELPEAMLSAALHEAGAVALEPGEVAAGTLPGVVDLLVRSGLVSSRGAARRTIAEGGAYLNNSRITDEEGAVTTDDLVHGRWLVLRRGKRHVAGIDVGPRTPRAR